MRAKIFVSLAVVLFAAGELFAHGTGFRISELKSVSLEFFYSTGEKMSYREAKVFSPRDSKFALQSGRTDENGRFAFTPDSIGEWRVIVRDEEGHQCEAAINITDEQLVELKGNTSPEGMNIYLRALLGVSLIFNLAFLIKFSIRRHHAH